VAAFAAIGQHRGQRLGRLGAALAEALQLAEKAEAGGPKEGVEHAHVEASAPIDNVHQKVQDKKAAYVEASGPIDNVQAKDQDKGAQGAHVEASSPSDNVPAKVQDKEAAREEASNPIDNVQAKDQAKEDKEESKGTEDAGPQTRRRRSGKGIDQGRAFVVDNSQLQAPSSRIAFRASKKWGDRCADGVTWGTELRAVDGGDGWARIGHRFLPFVSPTGDTILVPK
jgi:hypothetical protein